MTTYFIVDDHAPFRRQARALLEAEGLTIIGEATDAESALDGVRRLRPDVVVLDIGLPGVDGFRVADRLAGEIPRPRVVLISSRDETTYESRIAASPTVGFVRKDDLSASALRALLFPDAWTGDS